VALILVPEAFLDEQFLGILKTGCWLEYPLVTLLAVGREPDQPVMSFTTQARAEKDATPVDQAAVA